tara:strand:+ start:310 stop:558 length:249 start_codon:yes stop_codon:yes gene_type:complete
VSADQKLKLAASLIEEVAATLCTESTRCDHCGCTAYKDYPARKLHDRLSPLPKRLRECAGALRVMNDPDTLEDERGRLLPKP